MLDANKFADVILCVKVDALLTVEENIKTLINILINPFIMKIFKKETTTKKLGILCLFAGMVLLNGCQDKLDVEEGISSSSVKSYELAGEVTKSEPIGEDPTTRALTILPDGQLSDRWDVGEKAIAYSLKDGLVPTGQYSMFTALDEGETTRFLGGFVTYYPLTPADEVALFYPANALSGTNPLVYPVKKERVNQLGTNYVFHTKTTGTSNLLEIDMSRQDGSVETINKMYDIQWTKSKPTQVFDNSVEMNFSRLTRKITLWGFRFVDSDGKYITNIDSMYLSNMKSHDVFNLATGQLEDDNTMEETMNITLRPKAGTKFNVKASDYIYVAIFPGTYQDVTVTIYVGNKIYTKTFTKEMTLKENWLYRTDVKDANDVGRKPYVEVQGVKWATGNFIHYGIPGFRDYWGIAPAQWWISDRAVSNGRGALVSSQFTTKNYSRSEDLDLFRFGDITNALNVRSDTYKQGSWDISKKFFRYAGPLRRPVTDNINYGDIVWFYTRHHNQKYRMPTRWELDALYHRANVMPAYCVTDKGTLVYGAYFYTNTDAKRKRAFPTKLNSLYKYTNVTALVHANKGLFLPITGRRVTGQNVIGYRDMKWNGVGYAQYMSANSSTSLLSLDFFFGPCEWNFSANAKGQAKAIRPVWDESSNKKDNPVYAPFKNIR